MIVKALLITGLLAAAGASDPPVEAPDPPAASQPPDKPAGNDDAPKGVEKKTEKVNGDDASKKPPKDSLDDDLFDDLSGDLFDGLDDDLFDKSGKTKGEDGQPPGDGQPLTDQLDGEDVGAGGDPLVGLGRRMREVEERIAETQSGAKTQALQEEILSELAKLIDEARRRAKKKSSASQGSPQKTSGRDKIKQARASGSAGQNPASSAASNSTERVGRGEAHKPDMAEMNDLAKALWGHLPERLRQQMQQSPIEEFLPQYELLIEEYFKRLAKRYQNRP